jgi:ectoine hydroxylase-related dioxygenase (phytanoyl-CoA dioxygenase family)
MSLLRGQLETGTGWHVIHNAFPETLIDEVNNNLHRLKPTRGFNKQRTYIEGDIIKDWESNLMLWWSQQTTNFPGVQEINQIILKQFNGLLDDPVLYASDVVTIEPGSTIVNPHVDTPHRFTQWNFDERMLAIQAIVALHDFDSTSGSTGVWTGSQQYDWDINDCYRGRHTDEFLKNVTQPEMPRNSMLFYNCRLMHSSMPNPSDRPRRALLLHYCTEPLLESLHDVDNIWLT